MPRVPRHCCFTKFLFSSSCTLCIFEPLGLHPDAVHLLAFLPVYKQPAIDRHLVRAEAAGVWIGVTRCRVKNVAQFIWREKID